MMGCLFRSRFAFSVRDLVKELSSLILSFYTVFSDTPSRSHLIEHDLEVGYVAPICGYFFIGSFPKSEDRFEVHV